MKSDVAQKLVKKSQTPGSLKTSSSKQVGVELKSVFLLDRYRPIPTAHLANFQSDSGRRQRGVELSKPGPSFETNYIRVSATPRLASLRLNHANRWTSIQVTDLIEAIGYDLVERTQ